MKQEFNLSKNYLFVLTLFMSVFQNIAAQIAVPTAPTFNANQDPKPLAKKWVIMEELSDEFDDDSFDFVKWRKTSSGNWIGRPPGLFEAENVTESDENLRIKARKLPVNQTINGDLFTHGGGYVESNAPARPRFDDPSAPGLYLECRMKANVTFMSSTFWLNNRRNEAPEGCDRRTTELDIQECVGTLTGTSSLALRGWDRIMHSNAHSRSTSCPETPVGSSAKWKDIGENVAEDYHVYGAWWKSPREVICYLDGVEFQTVIPKSDFNLNLYLRLVIETYDWNPTPADGGMNFSELERTTLYDWVRVWKLEDDIVLEDEVVIANSPASVERGSVIEVDVNYKVSSDADVVLALYGPSGTPFYKNVKREVLSGQGTVKLQLQTEATWPVADDYDLRVIIRDVGGNFMTDRDRKDTTIDVKENTLSSDIFLDSQKEEINIYPNPVSEDFFNIDFNINISEADLRIFDLKGNIVLATTTDGGTNKIAIEGLLTGIYLLKVENENINYISKLFIQ